MCFKYLLTIIRTQKLWRITKSICQCLVLIKGNLLCDAWAVELVISPICTDTEFFLSQHRCWIILHLLSCYITWCLEKIFQFVWMLHTQVCWSVNFSVCSLPLHKIVLNSWTFSPPNISLIPRPIPPWGEAWYTLFSHIPLYFPWKVWCTSLSVCGRLY